MIDFRYLGTGINGLANAHKAGNLAGHLGAAIVAGYFFGEDQSTLPDAVYRGVEGELDRIFAGEESIWWNVKKSGVTASDLFAPFPDEEDKPESIEAIAAALRKNVGTLRESGHNAIFASLAIRATKEHPEFAKPQVIRGMTRLIAGFDSAHPGRGYYGKAKGWAYGNMVELADNAENPPYSSISEMAEATVTELISTAPIRKQGFGGLWHLVNHAAAIVELDRLGFHELALIALPAHHSHLLLWRSLPDVEAELGPVKKAGHDPRDPAYWTGMFQRDEARLTHRIKTLYGFGTLRRSIDDESRLKAAENAFLYLMA